MPVKFDQHANIDAPPEIVWSVISDPNKWPLWFPNIDRVSNVSNVASGGTFQWQHGTDTGSGAIVHVDEAAYQLKILTDMEGRQVTHTFDVDKSGGFLGFGGNDSQLRYTMEYDPPGGMLSDFVAGGNPADTLRVKGTLNKVKELAEGQAGKR